MTSELTSKAYAALITEYRQRLTQLIAEINEYSNSPVGRLVGCDGQCSPYPIGCGQAQTCAAGRERRRLARRIHSKSPLWSAM